MFLKFILFVCLWSSGFGQLNVNDKCTSADGAEGICKTAIQCSPAVKAIKKDGFHTLKRCGFLDLDEIVCCIEDGFGDRTADLTTEAPPPKKTMPVPPSSNTGGSSAFAPIPKDELRPSAMMTSTTTAKPLRIAERECQRIKQMLPPPTDQYILGGTEAYLGEFPHIVQVGYIDETRDRGLQFLCGGTLISENYVMSAAHCFNTRGLRLRQPVLVRLGVVSLVGNIYNPKTDYNISMIVTHPKFSRHSNDIALIKLVRPVPVSENAHPGCLYTRQELPSHATVAGWGIADYENKVYSSNLLKANLTIVSTQKCSEEYNSKQLRQPIEDNMLCAGDNSGKDACQGDSGGPLQAFTDKDGHYRIIGIVSFGVSCGTKIPGVYVRVSSHLDWIESIVWPSEA